MEFRRLFVRVLSFGIFAVASSAFADSAEPGARLPEDLGPTLASIVARDRVPGIAAVVLRGNQIVAQGVAGVRKRGAPEPITLNDQFLICSATKAMTATLAAMAVEEGRLSWGSTITEVLGPSAKRINSAWSSATLAQLLEHKAGAPADTARLWTLLRVEFFTRGTPVEKRGKVIQSVLSRAPVYPPGAGYVYSTLDYLIVDSMLEKVYDSSWEVLIRERLWRPLDMTTADFGPPVTAGRDQPFGHLGILLPGHPIGSNSLWSRLTMPAGFNLARMSIGDWAKFVAIHLRGDPENPHREAALLKPDSFAILHALSADKFYESGWFRADFPWSSHGQGETGRVITSQGDNYAWHAEAWLAPKLDLAVLVVCNQGGPTPGKPASLASTDVLKALRPLMGPAASGLSASRSRPIAGAHLEQ